MRGPGGEWTPEGISRNNKGTRPSNNICRDGPKGSPGGPYLIALVSSVQ